MKSLTQREHLSDEPAQVQRLQ